MLQIAFVGVLVDSLYTEGYQTYSNKLFFTLSDRLALNYKCLNIDEIIKIYFSKCGQGSGIINCNMFGYSAYLDSLMLDELRNYSKMLSLTFNNYLVLSINTFYRTFNEGQYSLFRLAEIHEIINTFQYVFLHHFPSLASQYQVSQSHI